MNDQTVAIDPKTAVKASVATLAGSRAMLKKFLDAFSDEEFCATPVPNFHNAYYIAGHVAFADIGFIKIAGGPELTWEPAESVFGFGIEFDPAKQPCDRAEIMQKLDESRDALIAYFRTLDEAKLNEELPEQYKDFCPTVGSILPLLEWHEAMHTGQLTAIRRALGHGPLLG